MRAGAKSITIWALPLAVLALAAVVFRFDLGAAATRLSGLEFDIYQTLKPRAYQDAPGGVHVRALAIDPQAVARYGNWPWSSDKLKLLTDRLKQAGASVVVFGFALDSADPASPQRFAAELPQTPDTEAARASLQGMMSSDESFAASFKGIKAATGYTLTGDGGDDSAPLKQPIAADGAKNPFGAVPRFDYATRALPLFEAESAGNGALNLSPDRDGVLRSVPLLYRLRDTVVPGLDLDVMRLEQGKIAAHGAEASIPALDGAAYIAGISVGTMLIPTRRDGAITLWFARDASARRLAASRVMDPASSLDLKNTIVAIGPPGNVIATSVGRKSVADVHAEALENMLSGQSLSESAGYLPQLVFLGVAGAATLLILMRFGVFWAGAFTLVAIGAAQGFGWLMFANSRLLIDTASPSLALAFGWLGGLAARGANIANARTNLRRSFAGLMPETVLDRVARDPALLKLGGETRTVTCLSCGLRHYGELSESFRDDPSDFTRMQNTAFAPLIAAVLEHGGTIAHIGGDGFTAFWNAPLDDPEHAIHACDAAQQMTVALASVNEQLAQERRFDGTSFAPVEIGIGISTGPAITGGLSAEGRTSYSVTGDCMLVAGRTQALSAQYGPAIVVSDDTRKAAERGYAFLEVDFIAAGAREEPVKLHAILGNPLVRASPKFRALATFHDHIFESIRSQQWEKARDLIDQCRKFSGASQKLYDLQLARIAWFEKNPPGSDWDGAFRPILK